MQACIRIDVHSNVLIHTHLFYRRWQQWRGMRRWWRCLSSMGPTLQPLLNMEGKPQILPLRLVTRALHLCSPCSDDRFFLFFVFVFVPAAGYIFDIKEGKGSEGGKKDRYAFNVNRTMYVRQFTTGAKTVFLLLFLWVCLYLIMIWKITVVMPMMLSFLYASHSSLGLHCPMIVRLE